MVRLGQNFLADPNLLDAILAALASIAASCPASSAPRASATTAAVITTLAGWLRLPRTGCGDR